MRPELLAPAGSFDALRAAVEAGADAVYMAGPEFNARRNAKNFTEDELREALLYCRERGVELQPCIQTQLAACSGKRPVCLKLVGRT